MYNCSRLIGLACIRAVRSRHLFSTKRPHNQNIFTFSCTQGINNGKQWLAISRGRLLAATSKGHLCHFTTSPHEYAYCRLWGTSHVLWRWWSANDRIHWELRLVDTRFFFLHSTWTSLSPPRALNKRLLCAFFYVRSRSGAFYAPLLTGLYSYWLKKKKKKIK